MFYGNRDAQGYGRIRESGTRSNALAHRVSYEAFNGPIPEGMVIDHLCQVTSCVNPDHLEAVTQKTNIQRGFAARGGKRTK